MPYVIKSATIRANNSPEGMARLDSLWRDVLNGKLPIIYDSEQQFQQGISPISKYSNYESDEHGDFDLSILGVTSDFFAGLERLVEAGRYVKYDESAGDLGTCTKNAWVRVWSDQQKGVIKRAYTEDFESSVPASYTKDGKCHCYLYIAISK